MDISSQTNTRGKYQLLHDKLRVSLGVLPVQRLKADAKLACVEKPSRNANSCNWTLPSSARSWSIWSVCLVRTLSSWLSAVGNGKDR